MRLEWGDGGGKRNEMGQNIIANRTKISTTAHGWTDDRKNIRSCRIWFSSGKTWPKKRLRENKTEIYHRRIVQNAQGTRTFN